VRGIDDEFFRDGNFPALVGARRAITRTADPLSEGLLAVTSGNPAVEPDRRSAAENRSSIKLAL
jgi:hypothetical protein